ncbi:hypothetical protein PN462_22725 [Spirulina sp. CS-785/01]|uniref:DUF6896 domain-containing protein n=1 Tax=Spirulina sp. CS-785/01 TaxID=3021716 RepID=UPI00232BAA48|nr:hypothetical protein [Spirulina sp. CS-785/01]MDB9315945.1 hypothetical protein [Spirulina sp. CS-785/01]
MELLQDEQEIKLLCKEFVNLQVQLLERFGEQVSDVNPQWPLLDCPKNGEIIACGEVWTFQRHGTGICFTGKTSGRIIDAHDEVFTHPQKIDSWRFSQYLESLGLQKIKINGDWIDILEDEEVLACYLSTLSPE